MKITTYIFFLVSILLFGCNPEETKQTKPNILFLYVDDLGYGDFESYNPQSKIPTPNIDRLAEEGISFTNAHTPAAICGPSRYGLITGRYPWRRGVEGTGNGEKFRDTFIESGRLTIASMLKDMGYNTAQMGKWGLRHNYSDAVKEGKEPGHRDSYDFPNKHLLGSQLFGFDYSWCMTHLFPAPGTKEIGHSKHTLENGLPVNPTLKVDDPYDWLPQSANKVVEYIETYAGKKDNPEFGIDSNNPFFIYWDPPSPHTPIVPNEEFLGKTGAGEYGDFVFEIDHYIGKMLDALDRLDLAENTIVIFSSDNGPEIYAYPRIQEYRHYSMGKLRGVKRDMYEGGTRVPFIVRWPDKIEKGIKTNEPICLTDMMASFADLFDYKLPDNAGEDSYSIQPVLFNEKLEKPLRGPIVYHTIDGRFAIRKNNMVFIDAPSGSQSQEPTWFRDERGVVSHNQDVELFDLAKDPQQLKNIAKKNPSIAKDMKISLDKMLINSTKQR